MAFDGQHSRGWIAFYVITWLLFGLFLGLMIWLAVEIGEVNPFLCSWPQTATIDDYVVFFNQAAEPLSGPPSSVTTGVSNSTTCQNTCNSDNACLFFTHNLTNQACYFYTSSVQYLQNSQGAAFGPTDLQANVFVKNTGRYMQQLNIQN